MTVGELINKLSKYDTNDQVMIRDGFNGGGDPREINFGPHEDQITSENAENAADCEDIVGETVVVLGYGCY